MAKVKLKPTRTELVRHKGQEDIVAIVNNAEAMGAQLVSITQLGEQDDCPPGQSKPYCWDWILVWQTQ